MSRKIFIVGNRFSGNRKAGKIIGELTQYLKANETAFEVFDTDEDGDATKTLDRLDQSFSDLIIIGGDGTVNESVNGLQYDIPVSIIPSGTGNDFIKNVDIGKKRKEQFETALKGKVRRIDVGKCNDRKFMNGVGIGFDGQIVEDMVSKRVPLLSGHAAYYYHVLRILGGYKVKRFQYRIDQKDFDQELILLTVGNGTTFGGGFKLMPDAKVDDGLLEICSIGSLSPFKRFANIHRLSNGSHGSLSMVSLSTAKHVRFEENNLLYAHIDGERMGQPPFDFEILPGALQLRVSS